MLNYRLIINKLLAENDKFYSLVMFIEVTVMISWPCMLKLDGDDELIYSNSLRDFNLECCEFIFSDHDYVIDSLGHCYLIEYISGALGLITANRMLSTYEASNLIRAHEFNKASLCLTKIHFLTVSEAIKSLSN